MSVMLTWSLPAWSMGSEDVEDTTFQSGRPVTHANTEFEEEEPEKSSITFMHIVGELRWIIFSILASSKSNGVAPELLALSSVSHQIRDDVTNLNFLRSCLKESSPHVWTAEDKDWDQPLFLFHILKKHHLYGYFEDFGEGCRPFLSLSESRLFAYRLALIGWRNKMSDTDEKLLETIMSAAMDSLLLEISPEGGFSDPKKDAAFLSIYFAQPNKDDRVEKRLEATKITLSGTPQERSTIPHHLLRIMSVKDQSLSREEKKAFFWNLFAGMILLENLIFTHTWSICHTVTKKVNNDF